MKLPMISRVNEKGVESMNYLASYQSFQHKNELNETVSAFLIRNKYGLNKTDQDVLVLLSRYAVKYPGVAHLKVSTIVEAVKKSIRTVQRSIRKLEHLQIIKRKPFTRKKRGGDGANLYIFLPFNDRGDMAPRHDTTKPTLDSTGDTKIESEPILSLSKDCGLNHTYALPTITHYERFKNHVRSFIADDHSEVANRLYGIYRGQTLRLMKFSIHADKEALFEALSIQAITITFQATKKKKIRNTFGYYDGVLRGLIDKAVFGDAFMDYDVAVQIRIPGEAEYGLKPVGQQK